MAEVKAVTQNGLFISSSFKNAWAIFKEEWITIYALQLLPILVAVGYTMVLPSIDENSSLAVVFPLLYLVVQFILSMGVVKGLLNVTRKEKVTMETFTSVAPHALKYIAAQFLMMLIVLGGFILFIIPGIIFSIKYMFTPYLVIDKGMGPIEALKASARMTDGVKWDLVGFMGAAVILMYSGILALFVGLLVTIPVATVSYVLLYELLLKRQK